MAAPAGRNTGTKAAAFGLNAGTAGAGLGDDGGVMCGPPCAGPGWLLRIYRSRRRRFFAIRFCYAFHYHLDPEITTQSRYKLTCSFINLLLSSLFILVSTLSSIPCTCLWSSLPAAAAIPGLTVSYACYCCRIEGLLSATERALLRVSEEVSSP